MRPQLAAGDALGLALLGLLLLVVLVMAFWPYLLAGLTVVLLVQGLRQLLARQRFQALQRLLVPARRWLVGEICRMGESYGRIEALQLEGPVLQPRLSLRIHGLEEQDGVGVQGCLTELRLEPPPRLDSLANHAGFRRFLASQDVQLVEELSVEAKAMVAALACLKEQEWSRRALRDVEARQETIATSLAKAEGNELLAAAVPKLQRASRQFEGEREGLSTYLAEAQTMLRKLFDFLSVPASLRPVIDFDLDAMLDPRRRQDLQASFQSVVELNTAYEELSAASPLSAGELRPRPRAAQRPGPGPRQAPAAPRQGDASDR